jgi:hypothetical protein
MRVAINAASCLSYKESTHPSVAVSTSLELSQCHWKVSSLSAASGYSMPTDPWYQAIGITTLACAKAVI